MGKAKYPHDSSRPERAAVRRAIEADDKEALRASLTHRQRAFAHEYVVDFNGTAAAIRAGYSVNNADKQAYLLTKHKGIAAYIEHLTKSKQAKVMSVNPEYLLQKLTEVMNDDSVRVADKLRSVEMYMKHLGMFVDKTEITGKDGGAIEVEQRRVEEEAEQFTHLLNGLRKKEDEKKDVTFQ